MDSLGRSHDIADYIHKHRFWYFSLGALLILTGIFAVAYSSFSTLIAMYIIGGIIAANGILEAFHAFRIQRWSGFLLHLAIGIIFTVLGAFVIFNPIENIGITTLVIGIMFILAGIFRLLFSFGLDMPYWWWVALSGVLSIIIGVMIWRQWPVSSLWVLGTLIGADLIVSGASWVMVALSSENAQGVAIHRTQKQHRNNDNVHGSQKKN